MEQRFLIKDGNPRLTLLFSGWGGEESLFSCYRPAGSDYMLCWDYRSLDFRPGLLAGYREIKVVAWSLGVCGTLAGIFCAILTASING